MTPAAHQLALPFPRALRRAVKALGKRVEVLSLDDWCSRRDGPGESRNGGWKMEGAGPADSHSMARGRAGAGGAQ